MPDDQRPAAFNPVARRGWIESVQVSDGGVPKREVSGPVEVTKNGVTGDRQRDLRFHGGPDRAVCLLAREIIDDLRGEGHPIAPGTTGENLTVRGLDWNLVETGARLKVGTVTLEITKAANPCRNIAGSFFDGDFSPVSARLHPGRARMYARVLVPGVIKAGDAVECLPAPQPGS